MQKKPEIETPQLTSKPDMQDAVQARITELEAENQALVERGNGIGRQMQQAQASINEINTQIVSNNGAIIEMRKLVAPPEN